MMNIKSVNSQLNFNGGLITKKNVVLLNNIEKKYRPYDTNFTHPKFDCFIFYDDLYTSKVESRLVESLIRSNYLIAQLPNVKTMNNLMEIAQGIIEKLK